MVTVCAELLQAELEQVQAAFMKELKDVNEKLNTSEKAVAELRQMRCNLFFVFTLCILVLKGM